MEIKRLKKIAYENGILAAQNERLHIEALAFLETSGERFHNIRRAKMDCAIFDRHSIEITAGELLAGRFSNSFSAPEEEKELYHKARKMMDASPLGGHWSASTGHRVLDIEKLLTVGVEGLLAEIEEKRLALDFSQPEDAEKAVVYESMKISLEGFCRFARRFHDKLEALAEAEADGELKAQYQAMAANFSKAPYKPSSSFYEALQTSWLLQTATCLVGDISLAGRPDSYLYPFYLKDTKAGVITKEFAEDLVASYYFKHNELYGAWPASIMVGGTGWNELSEIMLDAIRRTGLVNPSVAVVYTPDMPERILEKCVGLIAEGYTKPSFFNDRVVREGLEAAGVSAEDAKNYIHSTCVEITPIANSNIQVATPYINPTKALEHVLGGGQPLFGNEAWLERSTPINVKTFDEFLKSVKAALSEIIRSRMVVNAFDSLARKRYASSPLASALTCGCIEKGLDAGAGGAKYNFIYPCFPGFVTLVDSLAAVKKAVYDDKVITIKELSEICASNFDNTERTRQYLVNRCEKFGNGLEDVDAIAVDMYDFIRNELGRYRHCQVTGTFHPSYFAWIKHGELGMQAAATPDGRRQGEALSENLGASQGMDRNTPLGVVQSISKIEQKYGIGGIATNFRFSKSFLSTDEGKKALASFIRHFMDAGCFEAQFNSVDQETLLKAQKNPEKYATLMVRVAGYSDYFTNLSKEIQAEIIKRTEHSQT
ncbi:MAG: hypothetical protein LBT59_03685 [Clostridiales bacterium]|jgi:formate C-acetyltransferase|nr:hypothetical protein [Clostridiales bacterium]